MGEYLSWSAFSVKGENRDSFHFYADVAPGIGGFRGLRLNGSELESPDLAVGTSPFPGLSLSFRPSLPH